MQHDTTSAYRTMRTGQIAKALGLSVQTVRAYAREGRIPASPTPGGQYRFDLEEVRRTLTPVTGVALRPARSLVPLARATVAVGMATRTVVDERNLGEQAITGYVRESDTASEGGAAGDRPVVVRARTVASATNIKGRHRGTKRAAKVLADAPTAAFAVLR